jgi:hypothetical protein
VSDLVFGLDLAGRSRRNFVVEIETDFSASASQNRHGLAWPCHRQWSSPNCRNCFVYPGMSSSTFRPRRSVDAWPARLPPVAPDHRGILESEIAYFAAPATNFPIYGEIMGDAHKIRSSALSRRSILRNLAIGAGGAAMLATTVAGSRDAAAQTKVTQKAVGYQDTPHGAQRCDNCRQFEPPSSCKTVQGTIAPAGWCKIYVTKPA